MYKDGAGKMAHWGRELVIKLGNPSSTPRAHMMENHMIENQLSQVFL